MNIVRHHLIESGSQMYPRVEKLKEIYMLTTSEAPEHQRQNTLKSVREKID